MHFSKLCNRQSQAETVQLLFKAQTLQDSVCTAL
uniref:Uncharacterized protein n=1 Tax=Anguilla anguilla TaxID=7936 RepID=A0A0E9VAK4_ANGAN